MSPARTITHTRTVEFSKAGHPVQWNQGGRNGSERPARQGPANMSDATQFASPLGKPLKAVFTPPKATANGKHDLVVTGLDTVGCNVTHFNNPDPKTPGGNQVLLVTLFRVVAVNREGQTVTEETFFTDTDFRPNWMEGVPAEYIPLVNATLDLARTRFATRSTFLAPPKAKTGKVKTATNAIEAAARAVISAGAEVQAALTSWAPPSGFAAPNPFAAPPSGPAFG